MSCPALPDVFQGMYTCTNGLYYDSRCTLQCPDATENVRFHSIFLAGDTLEDFQILSDSKNVGDSTTQLMTVANPQWSAIPARWTNPSSWSSFGKFTFLFATIDRASSCVFFFWFDLRFTLGHWLYIQMMEASGFKKKANDKITKNLHSSVYSQSMVWSSKIIILTPHTEGQVKTNLQPNFKVNSLWNSLLLLHPHLEMWSYISVSLTL